MHFYKKNLENKYTVLTQLVYMTLTSFNNFHWALNKSFIFHTNMYLSEQ